MDVTGGITPYVAGMAGCGVVTVATLVITGRSRKSARRRLGSLALRLGHDAVDPEAGGTERVLARLERAAERVVVAHNEAEQRAARLAGALDAMPVGVILTDDLGQVEFRNVQAEALGGGHGDIVVQKALIQLLEQSVNLDAPVEKELDLFGPPRRHYRLRARAVDDGRRSVGVMATVEDDTERRRMDELRRDFIANAGHELRSPVGALAVLAEMLAEETSGPVMKKLAVRLGEEAERVVRVLEDLIDLSRLEAEENPLRQAVSMVSVISEAVARVTPTADRRGVDVVPPPSRRRVSVVGDRRQLISAVFNLLENAVKFSERDQRVEMFLDLEGDRVRVTVKDEGIGVPVREVDRIFERFYRVDRGRDDDVGGSGLGLSIVRHVALGHGGSVTVDSAEGRGSVFILELPAALDQPRPTDATGSVPMIPGASITALGTPAVGAPAVGAPSAGSPEPVAPDTSDVPGSAAGDDVGAEIGAEGGGDSDGAVGAPVGLDQGRPDAGPGQS